MDENQTCEGIRSLRKDVKVHTGYDNVATP